jgi:hypothetical protein
MLITSLSKSKSVSETVSESEKCADPPKQIFGIHNPVVRDAEGEPELVQATTENIAAFTEAVNKIETEEIANFTSALTSAFTLLEKYR